MASQVVKATGRWVGIQSLSLGHSDDERCHFWWAFYKGCKSFWLAVFIVPWKCSLLVTTGLTGEMRVRCSNRWVFLPMWAALGALAGCLYPVQIWPQIYQSLSNPWPSDNVLFKSQSWLLRSFLLSFYRLLVARGKESIVTYIYLSLSSRENSNCGGQCPASHGPEILPVQRTLWRKPGM